MASRLFTLPANVTPLRWWRVDTSSGSDTPATITPPQGGAPIRGLFRSDETGRLTGVSFQGPDGATALYLKELDREIGGTANLAHTIALDSSVALPAPAPSNPGAGLTIEQIAAGLTALGWSGGGGGGGSSVTIDADGTLVVDGVTVEVGTDAEIAAALASKAPLASPALTGNPTAPTPTAGDNDTSIATTAFVHNSIATFAGRGLWTTSTAYAVGDYVYRGAYNWQCLTAHTSAFPFDATKWVRLGSFLPLPALQGIYYSNFGHSIAAGASAENASGWPTRLNKALLTSQYNTFAVNGQQSSNCAKSIMQAGIGPGSGAIGMLSFNGLTNDLATAAQVATAPKRSASFGNGLRAFLWYARSWGYSGSWVDDGAGACAYTGTWATNIDTANCRSTTAHSTTTLNDYVDITITPNSAGQAVIFLKGIDNTSFGTVGAEYSVKQGATVLATGTLSNQAHVGNGSLNTCHVAVPLTGLGTTSTVLRVTKTDANGTILILDGACVPSVNPPTVLVFKDPKINGITDSDMTGVWWPIIDSVISSIGAATVEIVVADPTAYLGSWNPATQTLDGTHPFDSGHDQMYQAAAEALYPLTFRKGQNAALS